MIYLKHVAWELDILIVDTYKKKDSFILDSNSKYVGTMMYKTLQVRSLKACLKAIYELIWSKKKVSLHGKILRNSKETIPVTAFYKQQGRRIWWRKFLKHAN